ncbi:hypothetical protein MP638_001017 [Amoeboaphelidium occidentale]|nr:hypothetical protein MP638_001017 [Amoeboaphelidium occidentale]
MSKQNVSLDTLRSNLKSVPQISHADRFNPLHSTPNVFEPVTLSHEDLQLMNERFNAAEQQVQHKPIIHTNTQWTEEFHASVSHPTPPVAHEMEMLSNAFDRAFHELPVQPLTNEFLEVESEALREEEEEADNTKGESLSDLAVSARHFMEQFSQNPKFAENEKFRKSNFLKFVTALSNDEYSVENGVLVKR